MKKRKKQQEGNYIEKIKEWQDHQYDPGYYTGGKIPPYLNHSGRPNLIGWLFAFSSIIYGITFAIAIARGFDIKQLTPITILIVLFGGIISIQFIAGIRLIRQAPSHVIKKDIRLILRILALTLVVVALIVTSICAAYKLNEKHDEVLVYSHAQFISMQDNNKYYIYFRDIDKKILCSSEEYNLLDTIPINANPEEVGYKINFEWNNLSPKEGKMLRISKERK